MRILVSLIIALSLHPQIMLTGGHRKIFSSTPVPGFVGEESKNSLTTNALAASNSAVCQSASYSYCLSYPDVESTGNTGIVSFQYDNGSVITPTTVTCHDDKTDTYTAYTGSVDATTGKWNGMCIGSLTGGVHFVWVTFGTTAVTQTMVEASSFYDLGAVDAKTSCFGASTTTANCGSVTTTQGNDVIYVQVCRTGTPLSTSAFQPGSGFTLGTEQYEDGCATEWEVDSSTGSITPSMTLGGSSSYIEFVTAVKATSAGTAPGSFYVAHLMSWSTPESVSGSFINQFSSMGNLLVATSVCGTLVPTTMSDSGSNVWAAAGTYTNGGASAGNALEWYVTNASANSTNLQTAATTGSGTNADCTWTYYDIVGAPTTNPFVERHAFTGTPTTTSLLPPAALTYVPESTSHMFILNGGQAFNTSISMAQPSSGNYWDGATNSGMSIDGPYPLDQNNVWDHSYFSSLGTLSLQINLGASTSEGNAYVIDADSYLSPSGVGAVQAVTGQGTSGSSLTITVPSTRSGNLLAIATGFYDGATVRTVSSVRTGNSCSAGTTFTQVPSAAAANVASTLLGTDIWYLASSPGATTSVIICYSGAVTISDGQYWELQKGSGGSWALDNSGNGAHIANTTYSSTTITGPSITTTGAADFCSAIAETTTSVTANPKSGNSFVYSGSALTLASGGAASSLLTVTAAAQTPVWSASNGTQNSSLACFE